MEKTIFVKADLEISCYNCANRVAKCEEKDSPYETYYCGISKEYIGDENGSIELILKCQEGKDWMVDQEAPLDYLVEDMTKYEVCNKDEVLFLRTEPISESGISAEEKELRKLLRKQITDVGDELFDKHGNKCSAVTITNVIRILLEKNDIHKTVGEIRKFSIKH